MHILNAKEIKQAFKVVKSPISIPTQRMSDSGTLPQKDTLFGNN